MKRKIALTGGIACGKSMAENCFRACGCHVIDADEIVRELEAPGGDAVTPIVATFGESMRDSEGGIDKRALAAVVFSDKQKRTQLEQIIFPLIRQKLSAWEAAHDGILIFSAALFYESGWEGDWREVVCVQASPATQMRRMCQKRAMSEAEAQARLAAQWPVAEKAQRATWVINNDSDDLETLQKQIKALVAKWQAPAATEQGIK